LCFEEEEEGKKKQKKNNIVNEKVSQTTREHIDRNVPL
jgi:hypothetical protein